MATLFGNSSLSPQQQQNNLIAQWTFFIEYVVIGEFQMKSGKYYFRLKDLPSKKSFYKIT